MKMLEIYSDAHLDAISDAAQTELTALWHWWSCQGTGNGDCIIDDAIPYDSRASRLDVPVEVVHVVHARINILRDIVEACCNAEDDDS